MYILKYLSAALVCLLLSCQMRAQKAFDMPEDMLRRDSSAVAVSPFSLSFVGAPLLVTGLVVKSGDADFRQLRNDYMPTFRWHYDDYIQYLPAAVMLGVKAGGVQGRSSWGRMLTSDAFSCIVLASAVRSVKAIARVERPDGSDHHSFPSGHTATAFMTATMLSREYGERNVLYSIGGYSVATLTGLSRMFNNKHWLSDVLSGAAIGIMSTELGYYLADLIFKDRGITYFDSAEDFPDALEPSFLGICLGWSTLIGDSVVGHDGALGLSPGRMAGIEGAYFFSSPHIGLGGRFKVSNTNVTKDGIPYEPLDLMTISGGAYFSYPVMRRLYAGGKLLAGFTHLYRDPAPDSGRLGRNTFSSGTGLSLTFMARHHLGMKFFADYDYHYRLCHGISLGGGMDIAF